MTLNIPGTENYIDPSFISMLQMNIKSYFEIFSGGPFAQAIALIWIFLIIVYTITKKVSAKEDELSVALDLRKFSKNQIVWENRIRKVFYLLLVITFLSFGPASYYFITKHTSMGILSTSVMVSSFTIMSSVIYMLPFLGAFIFKYLAYSRMSNTDFAHEKLISKLAQQTDFLNQEESLFLEFKSTFQTSYPTQPVKNITNSGEAFYTIGSKRKFKSLKEVEKLIQDMTLEAIVGFLNASGGELVIGINEKDNIKKVVGIEYEEFFSEDEYQRHIIQHIINRIGKNYLGDYIDSYFQKIDGKTIFVLKIKPFIPQKGQIPVLLDGKTCFKRTGPRTDEINSGEEFAQFIVGRTNLDSAL